MLTIYFSSRYWRTQGGKEYKWKRVSEYRMEVRLLVVALFYHRSDDYSVLR